MAITVVSLGLLTMAMVAGVQYVRTGIIDEKETITIVSVGFEKLVSAYDAFRITAQARPDADNWESEIESVIGPLPKTPYNMQWSFDQTTRGDWFCLSGDISSSALANLERSIDQLPTQSTRIAPACGATTSAPLGDTFPTPVAITCWITGASDQTPDPIHIDETETPVPGETVTSDPVVIEGIDTPTQAVIESDEDQPPEETANLIVSGVDTGASEATVIDGDTIQIKVGAPSEHGKKRGIKLWIGNRMTKWTVTCAHDTDPDPFGFANIYNTEPNTVFETKTITITGITGEQDINISGPKYLVLIVNDVVIQGTGATVSASENIRLRMKSSADYATQTCATVQLGHFKTDWCIRTRFGDTTADIPDFPDLTEQPIGEQLSAKLPVGGFDGKLKASIKGDNEPQFRIDDGPWQTKGNIVAGQTLQLRFEKVRIHGKTCTAKLKIGNKSTVWQVTTRTATSCLDILKSGDSMGDGIYRIDPEGGKKSKPVDVWCDMTREGGGWTLVARNTTACQRDFERRKNNLWHADNLLIPKKAAPGRIDFKSINSLFQNGEHLMRHDIDGKTDAVFLRIDKPDKFSVAPFIFRWSGSKLGRLNRDFALFDSRADAITGTDPWQFCNKNSWWGFPRNCGPKDPRALRWFTSRFIISDGIKEIWIR
ncbi:MAG: fibrinogen-like YCDxxxxGGGW domain-containing protein [Pseudomonadota bacterium]|nr:fibrinogen-like YCDxxxxGGGW domain-containing protein [Pseudomonadota bacterium]